MEATFESEPRQLAAISRLHSAAIDAGGQAVFEQLIVELMHATAAEGAFVADFPSDEVDHEFRVRAARGVSLDEQGPVERLRGASSWNAQSTFLDGHTCHVEFEPGHRIQIAVLRLRRPVGFVALVVPASAPDLFQGWRTLLDCAASMIGAVADDSESESDWNESELLCELDGDRRVQRMSRGCAMHFGLRHEVASGKVFEELFPEAERGFLIEFFGTIVPRNPVRSSVRQGPALDDELRWIRWTTRATFDAHGAVTGYRSVGEDITERRDAERERVRFESRLQQAQRLESVGVLASGIAHDFNNLTTGIVGNAGLAVDDLPQGSPARGYIDEIIRAGKRAAELCDQLLEYTGRRGTHRSTVCLSRMVEEMVGILRISVSKKARVELELSDAPGAVDVDATRIRQVVMNLITNASDALGADGGAIYVSTALCGSKQAWPTETTLLEPLPAEGYVELTVTDDGIGMNSETAHRIFDPFFTTKSAGRGLGMAAVRDIIRDHGGGIGLESQSGVGTTIRVLLPTTTKTLPTAAPEPEVEPAVSGGTVLVVDDEAAVRNFIRACLERYGFDCLVAEDGVSGLKMFRENQASIDVVLLDLTMPVLGGEEVLGEMLQLDPEATVILSSGYDKHETARRFAGRGVAGVLHKPFGPSELLAALRETEAAVTA